MSTNEIIKTDGFGLSVLKSSTSLVAVICALSVGVAAHAQIVLSDDPAVLNNEDVIDPGEGAEAAAVVVVGDEGGTTLDITNTGTIQGRGNAGAGAESAGDGIRFERQRVDGALDGSTTSLFTGAVTNSGLIASEGANGTVAGIRFVNGVSFQGTLTNEAGGVISGTQNGLYFGNPVGAGGGDHTGGVVNNFGTISSDSRAVNIDGFGLTFNNAGALLGTGDQRNGTVYADGGADDYTFNNLLGGLIDAGAGNTGSGFGVEIGGAVDGANTVLLVNDGTIAGRGNASAATNAAGDGVRIGNVGNVGVAELTATNTGTITSEGANGTVAGVRFVNGISFSGTFDNSGEISGVQNGVYFGNPVDGAGADHSNGVFNNLEGGVISSDSRAFNIDGLGLTVNNAGDILGTGDQRNGTIYADATSDGYTINNFSTGVVDAGVGNNGSGVSLQSGDVAGDVVSFSLNNAGFIAGRGTELTPAGVRVFQGADNVTVNGDIINTGTILSETSAAILIENVNFQGEITNSGTLTGASAFDASTALGAIAFNQAGGVLNGDFIGSDFADTVLISQAGNVINGSILGGVDTTIAEGGAVSFTGQQTIEGDVFVGGRLETDGLDIDGDLIFEGGALSVDLAGLSDGAFDVVNVLGDLEATDDFTFEFNFADGFDVDVGDQFEFLTIGGTNSLDLTLATIIVNGIANNASVGFNSLTNSLFVTVADVPIPGAAPLFLSAMLAGGYLRRRKKAA